MNHVVTSLIVFIVGGAIGYFVGTANSAPVAQDTHGGKMEGAMHGMMSGLEGKTGEDFDHAFLDEMIVHHEGAVQMAKQLLNQTTRPELQKLGNDIITAQVREIEMMKGWMNEWFGNEH